MSRAVQFTDYGSTDVLTLVEVPAAQLPQPGPGQVRVRAEAIGVNPLDWKIRSGVLSAVFPVAFPHVPGQDVAGVVDAVGEGVTAWSVGDEVFGMAARTYADHVVADADRLAAKPADMPWALAGALPTAADAAYRALAEVGIDEGAGTGAGDTVLVHAAAGGVGTVAVQLAVAWGASVVGTASESNHDYLRALGAVPVMYGDGLADRVRAAAPQGIDVILDAAGRGALDASVELVADRSRIGTIIDFEAAARLGVAGLRGGPGARTRERLDELVELYETGALRLHIGHRLSLADAAEAHRIVEGGHGRGKVVLLP
jgi:NADPH:quinone reductase-like Zn-dependent oxidoreductase